MRHLISAIALFLLASAVCFGQEEGVVLMDPEVRPMFYGGPASDFAIWVNARLQYPKAAKRKGIEGRVTLQFVIKKDGSMSDVRVVDGVDKSLDKEAVRVVSSSPKWTPGYVAGEPVDVRYIFPVIFSLK